MNNNFQEIYMRRCFDIARFGAGFVSPNPMVGAVIVHDNVIIGEGWHQFYGTAHAEVNAVNSVKESDLPLLSKSTMYVSLEPCCIYGKTPPCSNLIIDKKIPKVVISCLDSTAGVAGNSVKILQEAGVEVVTGVLEKEGLELASIRNTFASKNRPYIILKYAQSSDGFISKKEEQTWLTNPYSKRLTHKWRAETDAILVGTNTAAIDNPQLNNRYWSGPPPLRLAIDKSMKLDQNLNLFNDEQPTLIFTKNAVSIMGFERTQFIPLSFSENVPQQIVDTLAQGKISSLLVEGGTHTLQSFIDANLWDEARIFTVEKRLTEGIKAPVLPGSFVKTEKIISDTLTIVKNSC